MGHQVKVGKLLSAQVREFGNSKSGLWVLCLDLLSRLQVILEVVESNIEFRSGSIDLVVLSLEVSELLFQRAGGGNSQGNRDQ